MASFLFSAAIKCKERSFEQRRSGFAAALEPLNLGLERLYLEALFREQLHTLETSSGLVLKDLPELRELLIDATGLW